MLWLYGDGMGNLVWCGVVSCGVVWCRVVLWHLVPCYTACSLGVVQKCEVVLCNVKISYRFTTTPPPLFSFSLPSLDDMDSCGDMTESPKSVAVGIGTNKTEGTTSGSYIQVRKWLVWLWCKLRGSSM